jgi:hypothetical protein
MLKSTMDNVSSYSLFLLGFSLIGLGELRILQEFQATNGYHFYYLSSSLCFIFGSLVDEYWSTFESSAGNISGGE